MTTTTNLGLKKPAGSDLIDISALNDNSDVIDNYAGQVNTALAGKQSTLTFDSTPTANSTNPVTSGGVKTDQDRQDALEAQDRAALVELVDNGAKNLILNAMTTDITSRGVTATVNADKSITLTGVSESSNDFLLIYDFYSPSAASSTTNSIPAKTGVPMVCKGTGNASVRVQVISYNSSDDITVPSNNMNDNEFVLEKAYVTYRLWISKAADFTTPVTIYPMVCTKAAWDISRSYQPYRPSYDELIARIEALEGGS